MFSAVFLLGAYRGVSMNRKVFFFLVSIALFAVVIVLVLLGCSQDPEQTEVFNFFSGTDCMAPTLVSVRSESGAIIRLEFDEPVKVYARSFSPFSARADGRFVYVTLSRTLPPGKNSVVEGRVRDYSGNTTGFAVSVWGFNSRLPEIIINEFTTKGTAKSPDRTELRVLSGGNLEGLTLYCGIPGDCDASVMLGDLEVERDDMVVIWWTESLPSGVRERASGVFNICAETSSDSSSNNGTLVLCENPSLGAMVLDAVIYSNFSQSHEGFGTKTALQRARWVISSGAWSGDAVDCTSATATRSVSRIPSGSDTDTSDDWFITITSGSTFGGSNTSSVL